MHVFDDAHQPHPRALPHSVHDVCVAHSSVVWFVTTASTGMVAVRDADWRPNWPDEVRTGHAAEFHDHASHWREDEDGPEKLPELQAPAPSLPLEQ